MPTLTTRFTVNGVVHSVEHEARVTLLDLLRDGVLHAVQQAFINSDAFQCGYCTPGQIVSAVACIREGHAGSDAEIAEWMSGNVCRCTIASSRRAPHGCLS